MCILLVFLTHQVTSTPTLHSYTHTSIGFQTCHLCSWATPDLFLPISCSPVGKKAMTNLDSVSKSRGFADKDPYSQSYGFFSGRVQKWELDCKGWAPKNWCLKNVVLEKTLESHLESKEIKWVNPTGNQLWIFIGRTDAEVETPILWPPDANGWLNGKDLDAGKDMMQKEKGVTEDEIVR